MRALACLTLLIAAGGCTPGTFAGPSQGDVDAGMWEVSYGQSTSSGSDKPKQFCIRPEDIKTLTIEALTDDDTLDRCLRETQVVAGGHIHAGGKCDTPDGDIRGVEMTMDGRYDRTSFAIDRTEKAFGTTTRHIEGHRVGDCPKRPSLE